MQLRPCMELRELLQVYKHDALNHKQQKAARKTELDKMVLERHRANVVEEAREASKHESKVDLITHTRALSVLTTGYNTLTCAV